MARKKMTNKNEGRNVGEARSSDGSKRKQSSDDDDFTNPPQREQLTRKPDAKKQKIQLKNSRVIRNTSKQITDGSTSKQIIVGSTSKQSKETNELTDGGEIKRLLYRCIPKMIHEAVAKFNEAQKEAVYEMGFGAVLQYSIKEIPTALAYWCIRSYNSKSGSLDLHNGNRIYIDEQDVWLALGLPKGHISMQRNRKMIGNQIVEDWEKRLNRPHKRVRQNDVKEAMLGDKLGGDWFRINFLIMVEMCLIEASSDGYVRPKIVDYLHDLPNVCNLNWCKYLLDTLTLCHGAWKKKGDGSFNGPVLFLIIFYVDRIVDVGMQVDRLFPAVKAWNTELLKKRQIREQELGSFGDGRISNTFEHDDIEAKVICFGRSTETSEAEESTRKAKKYAAEISNAASVVRKAMSAFVEKVINVPISLASDAHVRETVHSSCKLLNISEPNTGMLDTTLVAATQDDWNNPKWEKYCIDAYDLYESVEKKQTILKGDKSTIAGEMNAEPFIPTNNVVEEGGDYKIPEEADEKDMLENMNQVYGEANVEDNIAYEDSEAKKEEKITLENVLPEQQDEAFKTGVIEEATKMIGNVIAEQQDDAFQSRVIDEPTKIIGNVIAELATSTGIQKEDTLEQDMAELRAKTVAELENRETIVTRSKAEKKPSQSLSSPYVVRRISAVPKLSKQEKEIYYWAVACKDKSEDDVVYYDGFIALTMYDIRSLAPQEHVSINVVNAWCTYLHSQERFRSSESYSRMFYSASACSSSVVSPNKQWDDDYSFKMFQERLMDEEKFIDDVELHNVDMVFFPIFQYKHFYVVCFNFREKAIVILDNSSSADLADITVKYSNVPHTLVRMFIKYLNSRNLEAKADLLEKTTITRLKMSWRDERNKNDCGIYTMRHLETYYGGTLNNWTIGLTEKPKPKKQLAYLRAKYCTALLCLDMSMHKEKVQKEARLFFKNANKEGLIDVDKFIMK